MVNVVHESWHDWNLGSIPRTWLSTVNQVKVNLEVVVNHLIEGAWRSPHFLMWMMPAGFLLACLSLPVGEQSLACHLIAFLQYPPWVCVPFRVNDEMRWDVDYEWIWYKAWEKTSKVLLPLLCMSDYLLWQYFYADFIDLDFPYIYFCFCFSFLSFFSTYGVHLHSGTW